MPRSAPLFALLVSLVLASNVPGELVRWEIVKREPYAGGKPRGDRGPYEQWTGTVYFAVDPSAAANKQIVDLALAPRNAAYPNPSWRGFDRRRHSRGSIFDRTERVNIRPPALTLSARGRARPSAARVAPDRITREDARSWT